MKWLATIFAILSVAASIRGYPTEDLLVNHCEPEYVQNWPLGIKSDDLDFTMNSKPDNSGPKFRINTQEDIRFVDAGSKHSMVLASASWDLYQPEMTQFLISIIADETNTKECQNPGILHSDSDKSEHISYTCPIYLVDRRSRLETESVVSVPFTWEAPKCGCVHIHAEVLGETNDMYTFEDDTFQGLKLKACVRRDEDADLIDYALEEYVDLNSLDEEDMEEERGMRIKKSSGTDEEENGTEIKVDAVDDVEDTEVEVEVGKKPKGKKAMRKKKMMHKKAKKIAKKIAKKHDLDKVPKKLIKKVMKKKMIKKAKKNCCWKGAKQGKTILKAIEAGETDDAVTCDAVPADFLQKKTDEGIITGEACSAFFKFCCNEIPSANSRPRIGQKMKMFKKQEKQARKEKKMSEQADLQVEDVDESINEVDEEVATEEKLSRKERKRLRKLKKQQQKALKKQMMEEQEADEV